MGTRGQVKITSIEFKTPIYLYQHFDSYNLMDKVCSALKRGVDRWDDPEYLTRIIFSEMIKDNILDTTGYGIGLEEHGDIDFLIDVDIDHSVVSEYSTDDMSIPLRTFIFGEIIL